MNSFKIKSYAKINLALNVTGKKSKLHNIESLISFIDLHDSITLRESNTKQHKINFFGKFSKNISKINTISKLLKILDKKKLLNNKPIQLNQLYKGHCFEQYKPFRAFEVRDQFYILVPTKNKLNNLIHMHRLD